MTQPLEPDPYEVRGRDFFPLETREDGSATSLIYLCDDPDVGIGWRLRTISESGDGTVDVTEGAITTKKARDLVNKVMWMQIVSSTMDLASDIVEDWPEVVTRLREEVRQ